MSPSYGAKRQARRFPTFLLAGTVLMIALAALGISRLQFRVDAVLVDSTAFANGTARWEVIGSPENAEAVPDGIRVENRSGTRAQVRVEALLPDHEGFGSGWVRFSATLEGVLANLSPDRKSRPIIASWFVTADGTRVRVDPRELEAGVDFSRQWHETRARANSAQQPLKKAVIGLFLREADGHVELGNARIEVVSLSPAYLTLLSLLFLTKALLVFIAARALRDHVPLRALLVPVLIATCIAALVALSEGMVDRLIRPPMSAVFGPDAANSLGSAFGAGHVAAFASLTFCLLLTRKSLSLSALRCLLLVTFLAFYSEVIQLHIPSRNSQLDDLWADAAGVLAGTALWLTFRTVFIVRFAKRH